MRIIHSAMIDIRDLHFSFGGGKGLFAGAEFLAGEGEICGLLGKNGAGKTTLLNLIAGLLRPQKGECRALGFVSADHNPAMLAQMYYLPDKPDAPPISGAAYLSAYAPFYPKFDRGAMRRWLDIFGVGAGQKLARLSSGERQKFFLAFAFASGCRLLLFDEPTNGLDIPSKSLFRRLMSEMSADGRAVLLSTHQVADVENIIETAAILEDGEFLLRASIAEINDKLVAEETAQQAAGADVLRAEKTPGGFVAVRARREGEVPSGIGLERLFYAVTENPAATRRAFGEEE